VRIPPDAILAPEKISGYLLVPKPRNDKSRYLARAGFTADNPDALASQIRRLTGASDPVSVRTTGFGEFFEIRGELVGPAAVVLSVILVWLKRTDGVFSFVTLVPDKESKG